jgi:hypothetical protein
MMLTTQLETCRNSEAESQRLLQKKLEQLQHARNSTEGITSRQLAQAIQNAAIAAAARKKVRASASPCIKSSIRLGLLALGFGLMPCTAFCGSGPGVRSNAVHSVLLLNLAQVSGSGVWSDLVYDLTLECGWAGWGIRSHSSRLGHAGFALAYTTKCMCLRGSRPSLTNVRVYHLVLQVKGILSLTDTVSVVCVCVCVSIACLHMLQDTCK